MIQVWTDGSINVNPNGRAVYAFIIRSESGYELKREAGIEGQGRGMSVNVAELSAAIHALEFLQRSNYQNASITIHSDSRTTCSAFSNKRLKNSQSKTIYYPYLLRAREIAKQFPNLRLLWIPREQNTDADILSKSI
jgi:ribonuclease HI